MGHDLYPSLDALLAPAALSALAGRPLTSVRRRPFDTEGFSGSVLQRIETDSGHGPAFVLKQISAERDWVMRATGDRHGREVRAWQQGLLDRLPPGLGHAVVACATDDAGWAVLMHDVGWALLPPGDGTISVTEQARLLDGLSALHAAFWEWPGAAEPDAGLCDLLHRYLLLAPSTGRCGGAGSLSATIVDGWELLGDLVDPAVGDLVYRLLEDLQPLCAALSRYPQTLLHGDSKLANVGLAECGPAQVLLLDWGLVGTGPPSVEIAWYLAVNSARLPVAKEEAITQYQRSLARRLGGRFDEQWWQPQFGLSLLGGFLQLGWAKAVGAARGEDEAVRAREQAELAWWSRKRTGLRRGCEHTLGTVSRVALGPVSPRIRSRVRRRRISRRSGWCSGGLAGAQPLAA